MTYYHVCIQEFYEVGGGYILDSSVEAESVIKRWFSLENVYSLISQKLAGTDFLCKTSFIQKNFFSLAPHVRWFCM